MYIVKKLFRLPVGHRLSKHKGLCKNPHGHNLRFEVYLSTEDLNSNDMVMDFGDLKVMVNKIIDEFDHCMILNPTDESSVAHYEGLGYRIKTISEGNEDPTAEVLCRYIYEQLKDKLATHGPNFINVDAIHIWENDNSMAGYYED